MFWGLNEIILKGIVDYFVNVYYCYFYFFVKISDNRLI